MSKSGREEQKVLVQELIESFEIISSSLDMYCDLEKVKAQRKRAIKWIKPETNILECGHGDEYIAPQQGSEEWRSSEACSIPTFTYHPAVNTIANPTDFKTCLVIVQKTFHLQPKWTGAC
jgi:hypothetical protein